MQALTVEQLQICFPKREESLKVFSLFFKNIATCVEKELQSYTVAPLKCSVAGEGFHFLNPAEKSNSRFELSKQKERLQIWLEVDRDFELMFCELCLGGSGMTSHDVEDSRPTTNFEKKLCQAVLSSFLPCIAAAALKCHAVELATVHNLDEANDVADSTALQCIQLTFLVNAYAMTGELRLSFPKLELENILRVSTRPKSGGRSAKDTMNECIFELGVYLKPTEFHLQEIATLQLGTVLPLGHSVDTPVHVRCEQFDVFEARINVKRSAIEIVLLPDQSGSNLTDSPIANQVL
jgi:flagellar motor switch protein FliM